MGQEWIINSEELKLETVGGQNCIVRGSTELLGDDGSVYHLTNYMSYGVSCFGGRLYTSSNLNSDDIHYWYRCSFKTTLIKLSLLFDSFILFSLKGRIGDAPLP